MKTQILLIVLLSPLASLANTFDASAHETSACAVLATESIPFQRATRQPGTAWQGWKPWSRENWSRAPFIPMDAIRKKRTAFV
jgi:hypothetical protein